MANNITSLYFSNTFGDLVRTSNNIVTAFNYLGFKDWDKPSGKFSISTSTTSGYGFEANTRSKLNYEVLITGAGYLQVDNNAEVKKTLTCSNTNTNMMCFDARGIANINFLNVTNTASSMLVSGNSTFQKNITVYKTTTTDYLLGNNATIVYTLEGDVARFLGNVSASNFNSNNSIFANKDVVSYRNMHSYGNIQSESDIIAADTVFTNITESRSYVNTSILYASEYIYGENIKANNLFFANNISANNISAKNIMADHIGAMVNDHPSVSDAYISNIVSDHITTQDMIISGKLDVYGETNYRAASILLTSETPAWKLGTIPIQLAVNRYWDSTTGLTYAANANAALFWSESSNRWRVVDTVNSPNHTSIVYDDILVYKDITDTISNTTVYKIASANSVNATYTYASTVNTKTNFAFTKANSAYDRANTSANSFVCVTGTAIPLNGSIKFLTLNGMSIDGTGNNITINTPQDVRSTATIQFASLGVGTAPSSTVGEIRSTNQIVAYYSDDRLKTKLGNIENALDKLVSLNGFYYEANDVAQNLGYDVKREIGVSAQEVQKVLPEIVENAPIDDKFLTVKYERLIPLLIEAIKELKIEIDNIKR